MFNLEGMKEYILSELENADLPRDYEFEVTYKSLYYMKRGVNKLGYSYIISNGIGSKKLFTVARTKAELDEFEKER